MTTIIAAYSIVLAGMIISALVKLKQKAKREAAELADSVFNHYYHRVAYRELTAWHLAAEHLYNNGRMDAYKIARDRLKACKARRTHTITYNNDKKTTATEVS